MPDIIIIKSLSLSMRYESNNYDISEDIYNSDFSFDGLYINLKKEF